MLKNYRTLIWMSTLAFSAIVSVYILSNMNRDEEVIDLDKNPADVLFIPKGQYSACMEMKDADREQCLNNAAQNTGNKNICFLTADFTHCYADMIGAKEDINICRLMRYTKGKRKCLKEFTCKGMQDEIKDFFVKLNYCETDMDCTTFKPFVRCPFTCSHFINDGTSTKELLATVKRYNKEKGCSACENLCSDRPDDKDLVCYQKKCIDARTFDKNN